MFMLWTSFAVCLPTWRMFSCRGKRLFPSINYKSREWAFLQLCTPVEVIFYLQWRVQLSFAIWCQQNHLRCTLCIIHQLLPWNYNFQSTNRFIFIFFITIRCTVIISYRSVYHMVSLIISRDAICRPHLVLQLSCGGTFSSICRTAWKRALVYKGA